MPLFSSRLDTSLSWTHEPVAFRPGLGRLCAKLITATDPGRRKVAKQSQTQIPFSFALHGEINFPLLFPGTPLGNMAGGKSLKAKTDQEAVREIQTRRERQQDRQTDSSAVEGSHRKSENKKRPRGSEREGERESRTDTDSGAVVPARNPETLSCDTLGLPAVTS